MPSDMLSVPGAREFWDRRHQTRDDLTSGGDISFDRAGNELFYALRLGLLLQVLGDPSSTAEPRRLLDAGCGKGWFSRALARCGYAVDAIDTSPAAIDACRTLGGPASYHMSSLRSWAPAGLYDVVVSVDVLFHILDDDEWRASLVNLAALVRLAGRLVAADWDSGPRRSLGSYQVFRGPLEYRHTVEPRGFRYDGFLPYGFRGSRIGLHAWTRTR